MPSNTLDEAGPFIVVAALGNHPRRLRAIWREPDSARGAVAAGDFDADGYSDLRWRHETKGVESMVFLCDAFRAWRSGIDHYETDSAWSIAAASGDRNADGALRRRLAQQRNQRPTWRLLTPRLVEPYD